MIRPIVGAKYEDPTAISATFDELEIRSNTPPVNIDRKLRVAFKAAMSSLSSLDLVVDPKESPPCRDADSLNLDRRKNEHSEREPSPTTSMRPESTYYWKIRQALLVVCITAFLVFISSYDPSHAGPVSQDTFSSVCFPTVCKVIVIVHHFSDF